MMRFIKCLSAAVLLIVLGLAGFIYLAPVQATHIVLDAGRQYSGLARKEIVLPDGMRYVYLDGGKGDVLMLLHGFGANKDNFTRVAHWLTPSYRVIVPDLLGFGESSKPADADYTSRAQAERLRNLVQALGIKTLHLGGNSMGGQIAMAYAVLYPKEVASLWLLDPAGIWSAPKSELASMIREQGHNPLIVHSAEEFVYTFSFVMSDPPFIPKPLLYVMAQGPINNALLAERIFKQIVLDSVEQRVAGLKTPTLIVWGDQDRVINVASAEILHQLLPHSQLAIMHGVGHLPMLERPRASAAAYLDFRARRHAVE